jgi:hypothetical protein
MLETYEREGLMDNGEWRMQKTADAESRILDDE